MAEGGFLVLGYVFFDLLPVPLVIPKFLAGGANGQKPAQFAYRVNGSLESIDRLLATLLQLHLSGDRSQGPQRQEGAILVVDLHRCLVLEPDDPPAGQGELVNRLDASGRFNLPSLQPSGVLQ